MLFPIGDDDRRLYKPTMVTTALLAANVIVYIFFQGFGADGAFTYGWSTIPAEITGGVDLIDPEVVNHQGERVQIPQAPGPSPIYLTLLSSMFMHGGLAHLGGNLLYLWIFGDNVEHRFGSRVFLGFYLISGLVATAAQIALDPDSVIPTLGASGAISGILGAYLVLFPRNKVHTILFLFWVVSLPAIVVIGFWIAMQLFSGWGTLTAAGQTTGGVAYAAHIGGFVAGVVMAAILRIFVKQERPTVYRSVLERQGRY